MKYHPLLPGIRGSSAEFTDPLSALREDVNRAFETFGRSVAPALFPHENLEFRMNVTEHDDVLRVTAELPGVDVGDIEILVDRDTLTIRGEKKEEKGDRSAERLTYECIYGTFARTIPLPFEAKPESVSAAFGNGVLTIAIPIPEAAQPRAKRIEIRPA